MEHGVLKKSTTGVKMSDLPSLAPEQKADATSVNNKDLFHTPLNTHQLLERDGDLLRSIDSGFSERNPFSSPEETPVAASTKNLPFVEEDTQTFKDNNFSPLSHLPSKLKRFRHRQFDVRPPILQLATNLHGYDSETSEEGVSKDGGFVDAEHESTEVAESLCKQSKQESVSYESEASSSSSSMSLSGNTDELEFSLQEMSLEEFSSSSSSLFCVTPEIRSRSNSDDLLAMSPSKANNGSESVSKLVMPGAALLDEVDGDVSPVTNTRSGIISEYKNVISLAQRHKLFSSSASDADSESECVPEHVSSSSLCNSPRSSPKKHGASVCMCNTEACSHSSRVPPLPHQYNLLDDHVQSVSPHKMNSDQTTALNVYSIVPLSQELLRSPSKRHSIESSSDQEFLCSRSPPKTRKIQNILTPSKSSQKKTRTPRKCRRRASFEEGSATAKHKNVIRSIFTDSVSDLRSPLVKKKQDCDVHGSFLTPTAVPRGLCATLELKPREPKMTFESVIEKFSPKDPSRLIGRYTGVRKFDVIAELSSKNILHCLQMVFSHLGDQDLGRVCGVSRVWKKALLSDPVAVGRMKVYKSRCEWEAVQRGQENSSKAVVGSPSQPEVPTQMTSSKGHLTTVQHQARHQTAAVPEVQETKAEVELLSYDKLRRCPQCQSSAKVLPRQDRAVCTSLSCGYDFCTLCFSSFHKSRRCKPLSLSTSKNDVAGTRKSKKNLRRL